MREDRADQEVVALVERGDVIVQELGHPFATDRNIWERQPWETDDQFELFTIYRDLPPMRRSQAEVAKKYRNIHHDKPNKTIERERVKRLSTSNHWVERVEAYSMYIDDRLREALESERVRTRIEYLDLGRELRQKATQALGVMEAIVYTEDDEGNKIARANLTPKQIIELAKAAHEFERFALMMDEPDRGTTVNIMNISDSELLDQAKEVLAAYGGEL